MKAKFEIEFDLEIFDDGTLDTCVVIENRLTGRGNIQRYDSEYRAQFDSDDDFLSAAFEEYADGIASMLQYDSNF